MSFGRKTFEKNSRRGLLFDSDQVPLAAADIDQQSKGQREIGFTGEMFDRLLFAVFENREVVLSSGCGIRAPFLSRTENRTFTTLTSTFKTVSAS